VELFRGFSQKSLLMEWLWQQNLFIHFDRHIEPVVPEIQYNLTITVISSLLPHDLTKAIIKRTGQSFFHCKSNLNERYNNGQAEFSGQNSAKLRNSLSENLFSHHTEKG
jgi:hypothetical protein